MQRRKLYYAQENIEPSPNCVILGFFLHQKEIQELLIRYRRVFIPTQSTIGGEKHGGAGAEESRLQDFGYGGRAESETEKARNKEPDGAHRTTTRNPVLVPSVLDDHVPPRPMLTRIHPQDFTSAFPPTTRNPNLVRKVYTAWYFRPSVTTKLRPFSDLRGGLLIPPPQSFYFPIPTFPKQGFVCN